MAVEILDRDRENPAKILRLVELDVNVQFNQPHGISFQRLF